MVKKTKNQGGIEKAVALQPYGSSNIRVVMPNPIANAVSSVVGRGPMPPLRYNAEEDNKSNTMSWYQLEDFSNTVADMISQTAIQFQNTIQLVQSVGHVTDMARFKANVDVTMVDLERFTEEFVSVKARHEGKNGIITDAADRMAYLSIFEDYRALAAYFQGTMHHKLIEFTEYALDAKDKMAAAEAAGDVKAPAVEEEAAYVEPSTEEPTHD